MKFINVEQTTDMMISVCQSIIKLNKPYLTEVDSKIGDGDHGIGMSKGMENAMNILRNKRPFSDINQILKLTGTSMLTSMGGASGIIFWFYVSGWYQRSRMRFTIRQEEIFRKK